MFKLEMEYCSKHGIPHSQFLSWSDLDQDKAIAHLLATLEACKNCGTVPSEWLDEAGEYREPPPYVAKSILCAGCEALNEVSSEIPDEKRSQYHVYLMPNEEVDDGGSSPSRQDRTPG